MRRLVSQVLILILVVSSAVGDLNETAQRDSGHFTDRMDTSCRYTAMGLIAINAVRILSSRENQSKMSDGKTIKSKRVTAAVPQSALE